MSSEPFDEKLFEMRLEALKDTQEGIQQMSSWCLQHRANHKKIVICWLNVFRKVRVEHRLVLFHLANDVIQYSKRKRYEFVESWATALQRATTMVRDEKVKGKILRIFSIWEQREIYSEEYLSDLSGLLNVSRPKKTQPPTEVSDDFQNSTLIASVRECVKLSEETDKSFKKLPKSPNTDIEAIKHQLKDRSHSQEVEKEIERYVTYIDSYNKHLQAEIKSRNRVLVNLDAAIKFYASQRGEVKVVVNAYKNFGSRIKLVKKKLDEIIPNLPSPMPSPDINAPSPEPDADLPLPDEQSSISINLFKNSINGYSSYLDGNLPFDINDFKRDDNNAVKTSSQPIEVIGSRADDEGFNSSIEYYKPESISAYSSGSNISIPGLNPMPVPPVQSEYTSLARSGQQYGCAPPPNPPLFGGNHSNMNNAYSPMMSGYTSNNSYLTSSAESNSYSTNTNMSTSTNMQPLMPPPPPMPPSVLGISNDGGGSGSRGRTQSTSSDEFNSTWDMNMTWTPMDNSNASPYNPNVINTPVSPPHFEREPHGSSTPIEYSEHDGPIGAGQDVDHRQLITLPAFNIEVKLGLNKDKTRQLDIDHRNLISLTGSPGLNNNKGNKTWVSTQDQTFRTKTGDVDYRTIDTIPMPDAPKTTSSSTSTTSSPSNTMAPPTTTSKPLSPQKSNTNSSTESQKDDGSARYDPADMVVDMDMSDDDPEEMFKETEKQVEEALLTESPQTSTIDENISQQTPSESADDTQTTETASGSVSGNTTRTALLETPPEYVPQNVWDTMSVQQMNMNISNYATENMGIDMQQNHQQPPWGGSRGQAEWNNMDGNHGRGGMCVPPPPRPPFPLSFQYQSNGAEYQGNGGGIRGRGRGWHQTQNPFRSFQGPPRGGPPAFDGSRPYIHRGGGMRMRGGYRGKFRGNNSWI